MAKINWQNAPTDQERREAMVTRLSRFRKAVEAEGVVVEGARFSGSADNRQALMEALSMAERMELTVFECWKDSDNQFHYNFPVAKVDEALVAIGMRRQALIAKEDQYAQRILAGEVENINSLDWTV